MTGDFAAICGVPNMKNGFTKIYEARYVAGVVAGMKLEELISNGTISPESTPEHFDENGNAKIGYVGAYNYAEVVSGYTAFFLGVQSIVPNVVMEVNYTNSWFDISAEKEAANALIQAGCKLISQHADSEGAPKACEEAGIPNVAYNLDTRSMGPNTALISSKISWEPYFKMIIEAVRDGKEIETDYCATTKEGAVLLTELNDKVAAEGTQAKLDEVKAKLESGELKVFDTSTFTVGGKALDENTMADVVPDDKFEVDTKVVYDGYFHESEKRSAPYFYIAIDGITGVFPDAK